MFKKSFVAIAALFAGLSAYATPGDISCKGTISGDTSIEAVVGRDNYEGPLAFVEVYKEGKSVAKFASEDVSQGSIYAEDAGEEELFAPTYIAAVGSQGLVYIHMPGPSEDKSIWVTLSLPLAKIDASSVVVNCDF